MHCGGSRLPCHHPGSVVGLRGLDTAGAVVSRSVRAGVDGKGGEVSVRRGRGAAMRNKTRHGVTIRPEFRMVIKTKHNGVASRPEITRSKASVTAGVVRGGVGDDVRAVAVHRLGSLCGADGLTCRCIDAAGGVEMKI